MPKLESFVTGSWTERRRLIRFRRQREHLRFSEELKLVPRGAVFAMLTLLLIAVGRHPLDVRATTSRNPGRSCRNSAWIRPS